MVYLNNNDSDSIYRLLKDVILRGVMVDESSREINLSIESVLESNKEHIEILRKNDWNN